MKKLLALLLSLVIVIGVMPNVAFAALNSDGSPLHSKELTVNDDGTYTIALNVTGDSIKQITKVNVIVIVDRSNSMDTQSGTGAYVASTGTTATMYGLIDGEYVLLSRNYSGGTWVYSYGGTQYTGQRYIYDTTATRIQATRAAVDGLSSTLLGYNGRGENPDDTVEMALVDFATTARTLVTKTTDATTFIDAVNGINPPGGNAGGTNWEMALRQADTIDFGDNDPTYVIFFSDGAPTFYGTGPSGSGQEQEPNMTNSYNASTDEAQALASKVGTERFYTIFAYGSSAGQTYMTSLTAAAGAPAGNNYSASNTVELEEAFGEILSKIEMAGIGAVSLQDGTTSKVTTTSGEISNLLTVDTNSFKYYRAGGDYNASANNGLGETWAEAPAATFTDGAVKWNLESEGVLENGVTYTVTFDCWPSQTSLDYAADIMNDSDSYDSLDANIRKYFNPDGTLKTNTTASVSYTDTRTGQSGSSDYVNPDPVSTSAIEQMAVSKEWENALDGQEAEPITLTVTRDNNPQYTMTLGNPADPDDPESEKVWTDNIYISVGILRHSDSGTAADSTGAKYEILETGHDYTFVEPSDLGYYWELQVPTVRPMMIDGTVTMLILKETNAPYNNPENETEYTIDNKIYYVGETGQASLTAVNHRRARLNLTKVVNGEDADPTQTFPFTLNVVDSKASEGSSNNLNSDYYVWFSVWNGGYVEAVESGAEKEITTDTEKMIDDTGWTGYYYAPSGTNIVVNLKNGDNLRFLNLPAGSTYTFTEGTLPANYTFTRSALNAKTWDENGNEVTVPNSEADSKFAGAQTTKGNIILTNTDYTVTYTNTYGLTDIEITKVWEDADDYDEIRPTAEQFKSDLVLKADGTDVTAANSGKLTVEVDPEDENVYIVKWTGLDRFASGEEITYSVEETAIVGYTTTGSPAEDHDTITNKHTPPAKAQIPVVKNVVPENSGAADITGKFTFTLAAGTNNAGGGIETPMPDSNTVLCGADGEEVEFGEITFIAPGTYNYTVTESETDGTVGGITLDSRGPRDVSVVVVEDETGKLTATVNGDEVVEFNNPYSVTSKNITIPVEKILEVPEFLTGPDITGAYTFTIADDTSDDVSSPLPTKTASITNPGPKGGSMTFGEEATTGTITVTEAGIYKYTITESGTVAGVTNENPASKTVTVTVINEGDGTLSYTINDPADETDDVTKFTNTYSAEPVEASFPVQKVLSVPADSEDAPETWEYTFKVAAPEGTPVATSMSATVTNANDTAVFGPFKFSKPGTYTYTVTEEGTVEGVVNDANAESGKTVTITVVDGKEGKLVVESISSTSKRPLQFTNSYHETALTIPVTKTLSKDPSNLTGPDITGQYTFTITGDNGAPLPETKSVTNSGGAMEFGPITFNEPGTYTYHATESGSVAGVTNDTDAKTVTVIVSRNEETGELTTAFAEDSDTSFDFVNKYTVKPVTASFSVKKVMSVTGLGPESWSYTINVVAQDGAPEAESMTGTVTNTNDTVTFGEFTFNKPGDYVYTVTESGEYAGVTNDPAAEEGKTVTITVTDNKDGTLNAVADNSTITFTNSYSYTSTAVVLQVNKTIDVADGVTAPDITGKYTFTLAAKGEAPMPESGEEIVTNPAADGGTTAFGQIIFDKPGTYTYTITESGSVSGIVNDPELTKTVTVSVVDGREGELVPTVDYGDGKANAEFVNKYEVIDIPVSKTWDDADDQDGYRPEEITVNLLADGTKVDTVKVKADKDGKWAYTFENVPKYGDNAKVITYTITEEKVDKYDTSISGNATDGFTITNKHVPEVTSVTITKKWNDNDNQDGYRPTADAFKAKLHLMADGTEVKNVVPAVNDNGDGTFTVTYTGLPKKAAGKDISYTVKEDSIDKYSADKSEVAAGGTIVNTHTPETYWIKVTKIWVDENDKYGLRPDSVKFTVTGDNGKTYDVTMKGTGSTWNTEIEVLKYRDGGTEVKYSVDEEKVTAGYTKKIEDLTITNTFKPVWGDPPVRKEVKGDKPPKAETFTFKLTAISTTAKLSDGKMPMPEAANGAQEMTMDVKSGDTKEFGKFDLVVPGVYTYTITEVPGDVKGYTYSTEKHTVVYTVTTNDDNSLKCVKTVDGVEIVGDETDKANASKFTIINEYTKPEETPPTGDTSNIFLWSGISAASLIGLGYIFIKRRKEEQ